MKQTLYFACFGCVWSTRILAISQGSDAGLNGGGHGSPYLRVFGDDRVRGTRDQVMLQVVLVELKAKAWAS
ncbi:hypothetical protein DEO72_LG7g1651 [Vigna unguiculata]|uniref:Secreted protein n=1 Tax=Vigna unguiculata TaxID=3917 RepID=A0A4D6MI20_VIGUN|nr:hypothetical protein DEO72_LG7g1651 [Vigna unguiculata]